MADLEAIHTNNRFSSHNFPTESTAGDFSVIEERICPNHRHALFAFHVV